jgi:hypothetical protein
MVETCRTLASVFYVWYGMEFFGNNTLSSRGDSEPRKKPTGNTTLNLKLPQIIPLLQPACLRYHGLSFQIAQSYVKMPSATDTRWSLEFDTARREKLFRSPPKDHSAYPALTEAVKPHVESFNSLFEGTNLLDLALQDIGTKSVLDHDNESEDQKQARVEAGRPPRRRNRFTVQMTELFCEKPVLPAQNKHNTRNREILPSECRERHATYRGRLRGRIRWRVNNGEWSETIRDLGALPIMVKVCQNSTVYYHLFLTGPFRPIDVIWIDALLLNSLPTKKNQKSSVDISLSTGTRG